MQPQCAVAGVPKPPARQDPHPRGEAAEGARSDDIDATLRFLHSAADARDASVSDILAWADALWADFRFGSAVCAFQKAAEREPQNPAPLLLAAKRLFSVGRFSESRQFLRAALKREPQNSSVRRMLAEVLERDGAQLEAEGLAREAFHQTPADPRTARALARIVRRLGRVHEAVEILRSHLSQYPDGESWRINYELAICLDLRGEYDNAMGALLRAKAELRPRAQLWLEQWHQRARRREEFAQLFDQSTLRRWRDAAEALHATRRIAILAGHPRSGTTLLEQMLARHSGIVTTDETGILRRQFIEPIVMAAQSSECAFAEVDGFDVEQLEAGRDFYFRATEEHVGERFGERLVIEKDPLATCDLGFILRLLPECRVIFPLRDPRDVCVSYFFTLLPLNADSAPALDLASTCAAVRLTLRLWKHWRSVIPQAWEEVRYERLVQNPRDELARLMESLSLPFEERMLTRCKVRSTRGIGTPTYADVAQPLYTRAIGRWRNYAPWLEPHLESLADLLTDFGYE